MSEDAPPKFRLADRGDGETPLPIADSLAAVEALFAKAFPAFRCPVCMNESFVVLRDFQAGEGPEVQFFRRGSTTATAFVPTLAINCADCGYVLPFAEGELRRRAERLK